MQQNGLLESPPLSAGRRQRGGGVCLLPLWLFPTPEFSEPLPPCTPVQTVMDLQPGAGVPDGHIHDTYYLVWTYIHIHMYSMRHNLQFWLYQSPYSPIRNILPRYILPQYIFSPLHPPSSSSPSPSCSLAALALAPDSIRLAVTFFCGFRGGTPISAHVSFSSLGLMTFPPHLPSSFSLSMRCMRY